MNYLILFLTLFLAITFILIYKNETKKNKIIKIISVLLFIVYLFRLFTFDEINHTFNVLLYDIETPIDSPSTWLFSQGMTIFMIMLRWTTLVSLILLVIHSFFETLEIKWIGAVVGFLSGVLNFIFFRNNLIAFEGEVILYSYRSIQFFIENSLLLFLSIIVFYKLIRNKSLWINPKKWYRIVFVLLVSMFALMPQALLVNLFGYYGEIPDEFTNSHIFVIIFPFIFMLIIYFIMRKQTQSDKDALITLFAFAGFVQYFFIRRESLAALPLHLCNTAVILLLFAVVFRIKRFFYFSYFANVLGALAAIILPNYSTDFFAYSVIHFGFNHLYAFIVPILAVALHTFPRPNLSHMYKALAVFSVYFFLVLFLNAWFNNYTTVDYFFTYSDFLTDMFGVRELQYNNVLEFSIQGLTFRFYWAFQLIYYFVFMILMFGSWFVYDAFYQMVDQHYLLRQKQKKMRVDHLRMLDLLDGRKPSEPMNPGGADMIRIMNFSKRYGQSERYAVKDFSLEVKGGEIYGFLGHNGAGKSTTIKSIVGIQSITEGEIEVCGYSIKSQPLEAKLRIGYVSDNHAVYEKLTGREYINYVADLYRVSKELRDQRLNDLAEKLSLSHAIDQMIKSYSHGMKQKLVVIASLIHEPPVWILDEPLTGLDPISSYQIKEIMREHARKGNIVFFSSHVIEVVEKICTKIAVITQGELTGVYDINILKDKNVSLEELYMKGIKNAKVEVDHA